MSYSIIPKQINVDSKTIDFNVEQQIEAIKTTSDYRVRDTATRTNSVTHTFSKDCPHGVLLTTVMRYISGSNLYLELRKNGVVIDVNNITEVDSGTRGYIFDYSTYNRMEISASSTGADLGYGTFMKINESFSEGDTLELRNTSGSVQFQQTEIQNLLENLGGTFS